MVKIKFESIVLKDGLYYMWENHGKGNLQLLKKGICLLIAFLRKKASKGSGGSIQGGVEGAF